MPTKYGDAVQQQIDAGRVHQHIVPSGEEWMIDTEVYSGVDFSDEQLKNMHATRTGKHSAIQYLVYNPVLLDLIFIKHEPYRPDWKNQIKVFSTLKKAEKYCDDCDEERTRLFTSIIE